MFTHFMGVTESASSSDAEQKLPLEASDITRAAVPLPWSPHKVHFTPGMRKMAALYASPTTYADVPSVAPPILRYPCSAPISTVCRERALIVMALSSAPIYVPTCTVVSCTPEPGGSNPTLTPFARLNVLDGVPVVS